MGRSARPEFEAVKMGTGELSVAAQARSLVTLKSRERANRVGEPREKTHKKFYLDPSLDLSIFIYTHVLQQHLYVYDVDECADVLMVDGRL